MAGIPSQRVRLNLSPCAAVSSNKQGPLRATVPVILMRRGSPPEKSVRKMPSPAMCFPYDGSKSRLSPDQRISPESRSSGSPGLKEGGRKPLGLLEGLVRRTTSLEALCLRDLPSYCGCPMVDEATQTPEDWSKETEKPRCLAQKKGALGAETLEIKFIRQRLQRTQVGGTSPCWSPVQGDHQAVPGATSPQPSGPVSIPCQQWWSVCSQVPPLVPRMRNSVEGLNQEIERLVSGGSSEWRNDDSDLDRVMGPTPEGHGAPVAELFRPTRSVDTQTPCEEPAARFSASRSPERDDSTSPDAGSRLGTSPQINRFLAREPPDGCEKVKVVEEGRKPTAGDPKDSVPKPSSQFVLRPSQSSAFCPLARNPCRDPRDALPPDAR